MNKNLENYVIVAEQHGKAKLVRITGTRGVYIEPAGSCLGDARTGYVEMTGTTKEVMEELVRIGKLPCT